jgi:hypothetical protein
VTVAASFNTTTDWIGIPTVLLALGLLIARDMTPVAPRSDVVYTALTAAAVAASVVLIAVRFVVMV